MMHWTAFFLLLAPAWAQSSPALASNARAASLLGGVGVTTVSGTDAYQSSITFPSGTTIGEIKTAHTQGRWIRFTESSHVH